MSEILIMGMKMPKSCDKCPIMMFEDTNCVPELYCGCPIVFKAHPQGVGNRPDYCPLVEIQPHGRLIDADELFKEMERKGWFDNADRDKAEDLVFDAPTIIPAEEGE